jgi:glutamate-5-semialdehyde dehydrogenase
LALLAQVILGMFIGGTLMLAKLAGWIGGDPLKSPLMLAGVNLLSFGLFIGLESRRRVFPAVFTWRFAPLALLAPFALLMVGLLIAVSQADNFLGAIMPTHGWLSRPVGPDLAAHPFGWALLFVVVAPVTEELFFRGIILRRLLQGHSVRRAIGISSLLFMAIHLNPWQFPVALIIGIGLGWVYSRTASLVLCMLGHAFVNFTVLILYDLPFQISGFNARDGALFHPWWFNLLGAVALVAGCAGIARLAPSRIWLLPAPAPIPEPPLLTPPPLAALPAGESFCTPAVLRDDNGQMSADLAQLVTSLAQRARAASLVLATAPTAKKDAALAKLADLIDASQATLLAANAQDLASPEAAALTAAARDRLTLNAARLQHLATSVREVIALPDPVGDLLEEMHRPNGLRIRKIRVPIGVIGIIYEARPNVTIDCAILCVKSGNACILRGGKECFHTNTALAALISQALAAAGLPADAVQLVPTTDRAALTTLLKLDTLIHCLIPRGGENLIRYVAENSTIPVIKHYKGVCFVYVDAAADLTMAEAITLNAKVSRPSACNAAEQLLVHRSVAEQFLPAVARALVAKKVELRCDAASAAILAREQLATTPATEADYATEFLDYVLAVRVVDSLDAAIATINRDGSNHSDAIVTRDEPTARRFLAEVDSATVYWNASTRFTDGYEFGYGAEIGISTDRLHARGPMGLRELCSHKFVIEGTGQIRG